MLLNEISATIIEIQALGDPAEEFLVLGELADGQRIAAQISRSIYEQGGFQIGEQAVFSFSPMDTQLGRGRATVQWPALEPGATELIVEAHRDPLGSLWTIRVTSLGSPETLADFIRTTALALRAEPLSAQEFEASLAQGNQDEGTEHRYIPQQISLDSDIVLSLELREPSFSGLAHKQFELIRTITS